MIESVDGLRVGRKRRALSSACIFFHGMGLAVVGAVYVYDPGESIKMIAEAWDVNPQPQLKRGQTEADISVLARNLVMVAAVYLAVWGVTCMVLATVALPQTKKAIATLNLFAALAVSLLSAFHPQAVAAKRCRGSIDNAMDCLAIAMKWHAPLVMLDILSILFAEAGPRFVRISDTTSILFNGDVSERVRNTTIKKINSHTDLIVQGEPKKNL